MTFESQKSERIMEILGQKIENVMIIFTFIVGKYVDTHRVYASVAMYST